MDNHEIKYCHHSDCQRKLKISNLSCKCGKIFCKFHKYPEQHKCDYDYKEKAHVEKKIEIMKSISNKIQKIN